MIDCNKITKDTKNLMFKMISDSTKDLRERHIELCENKYDNIVASSICIGSKCRVSIRKIYKHLCLKNTKTVGSFHTHPGGAKVPSPNDVIGIATRGSIQSLCIGYRNYDDPEQTDTIKCYDIVDKELLSLGRDAQETVRKGESPMLDIYLMRERVERNVEDMEQHPGWYWKDIDSLLKTKCEIINLSKN